MMVKMTINPINNPNHEKTGTATGAPLKVDKLLLLFWLLSSETALKEDLVLTNGGRVLCVQWMVI